MEVFSQSKLSGSGSKQDILAAYEAEQEADQANGFHPIDIDDVMYEASSIIDASLVTPKQVDWLWYPYLPVGMLVSAEGASDLGKSLVWVDIAVSLANGTALPDGTKLDTPVGVVWITAEESIDETLVPRLIKAGATSETRSRIRIIGYVKDDRDGHARPLNLEDKRDLALVERAVDQVDAKLIIGDPVTSLLGPKTDINQATQVRRALAPVVELARRKGVTFVNIRHHRKGNEGNFKEKGVGSPAFVEVARVGIAFEKDPEEEEEKSARLFVHFKHNLTEQAKPLKYRTVGEKRGIASVTWHGDSDLSESQILGKETGKQGELRIELATMIKAGCMDRQSIADALRDREEYTPGNITNTLSKMATGKNPQIYKSKRGEYCPSKFYVGAA